MNYHLFNFWPIVLDTTDIILIWFILYQVSFLFSNTRSKKIIVGSAIIGSMYVISITLQLEGISEVFKAINLVQIGSIVLVIIFSQEIKDALTTIGIKRVQYVDEDATTIEAINQASLRLSSNHVGALILIARRDNLKDLAKDAIPVKADVTSQILESIFFEPSLKAKGGNPLHDGAVIISDNKVVAAKVICKQLSESIELSHQGKGTRHAAGLGFSEQRDCVAIIISHETGEISLAVHNQKTIWAVQNADLLQELKNALGMNTKKSDIWQDINRWFLNRKIAKTVSLVIAVAIWCISNSILTISSNIPQPSIYEFDHQWKEGDYVLELNKNEKSQQDVKIEIKNWQRIVYLFRPNNGGLRALQDALAINTSEEYIKESIETDQRDLALKIEIDKKFKNEIKLIQSEDQKNYAHFKIKSIIKKDLKDFIKFNIKDHKEVKLITARTMASVFVPDNFVLENALSIDLLGENRFIEKVDSETWDELSRVEVFKKDYPDFAGMIDFSKIPALEHLAKYNTKIEVKFGISLIENEAVPASESEISLNESLAAVIGKYKKSPDKLVDFTKGTKPDRGQVITARKQMNKAIADFDDLETQKINYKNIFDSKNKMIKDNNITLRILEEKSIKTLLEEKRIKELKEKAIQIPREQTTCRNILDIYTKNTAIYEKRSKQSNLIYKKYASAFEPVLNIYQEAKTVFAETNKPTIPEKITKKFDNITKRINEVKSTDFTKNGADVRFLELNFKSLEEFLVLKYFANTPGSLHFLKLERKKLYEKMDVHLDQINKHLPPTAKTPVWSDLHKVQTFKFVEDIGLQHKQILLIDAKIKSYEKYLKKRNVFQDNLYKQLTKKLKELKVKPKKINVIWSVKDKNNLKQKIDKLKLEINKNIDIYKKNTNKTKRADKVFDLSLAKMDNDIVKLFFKELNELPAAYKDYTIEDSNLQYRKGFFIVNQMFFNVNGKWSIMHESIEKDTEEKNTLKLTKYLNLLIELENTINVYNK